MTQETIQFDESTYQFIWIEGGDIPQQNVTQVSGYVFDKNNKLLIVKNKKWTIPGGHPENGESSISTLRREVFEESMVEIDDVKYIGCVKVIDLSNNQIVYQLRFIAYPSIVHDFKNGFETTERLFIEPKDLISYIPWANGTVFSAEMRCAISNFKDKD